MNTRVNVPGFTAEASLYGTRSYYEIPGIGAGGTFGAVEAALMRRLDLDCSGTCPDGQILCKSDINCVCCTDGCIELIGGGVKCGKLFNQGFPRFAG